MSDSMHATVNQGASNRAQTSSPNATSAGTGSSRAVQLKREASQAGDFDAQEAALAPVQRHGGNQSAGDIHAAAARGIASGGGAMPHAAAIQQSFGGYDISNVQAHMGPQATEASEAMGADAYATGNHVAFKATPDLHTAAHEAAHVVQQQAGVQLSGGVGQVGDPYERHADAVADAVVAGQSAEPILARMAGPGGGASVQRHAVQHKGRRPRTERTTPGKKSRGARGRDGAPDPVVDQGLEDPTSDGKAVTEANAGDDAAAMEAHTQKVDSELAGIHAAATLEGFAAAVEAAPTLVKSASMRKVATRVGRLMRSRDRAMPVWRHLPRVDGEDAETAYWAKREQMANRLLPEKIKTGAFGAGAVDAVREAGPAVEDKKKVAAENVFWDVIVGSSFNINRPESTITPEQVDEIGGVVKCFDVGDAFKNMNGDVKKRWLESYGNDEAAAKEDFIKLAIAQKALPTRPRSGAASKGRRHRGVTSDPQSDEMFWSALNLNSIYTGVLRGFVGMGKDAEKAKSYDDAMKVFALNANWYPSKHMFVVHAPAETVKAQMEASKKGAGPAGTIGKPSIFCHLEFEEFLYSPHDRSFGELAKMDGDNATEKGNGVKELVASMPISDVWANARFI